jgi:fructose-bisphosphate aldolase class 1
MYSVYTLFSRCQEYKKLGCQFAKWRMVVNIGEDIPSAEAISEVSYSSSEEKDGLNRRS